MPHFTTDDRGSLLKTLIQARTALDLRKAAIWDVYASDDTDTDFFFAAGASAHDKMRADPHVQAIIAAMQHVQAAINVIGDIDPMTLPLPTVA